MDKPERLFMPQTIHQEKPDGSFRTRTLMVPNEETMLVHREMLRDLQGLGIAMPDATAGIPGMHVIDNAKKHRYGNYFYMMDLTDAFESVNVEELIHVAGSEIVPEEFRETLIDFIHQWGTAPDIQGLPLGAPCSPFLFNLYCLPMDKALGELCAIEDITYTRYLDDLTFSSQVKMTESLRRELRKTIEASPGMRINHAKSRLHPIANGPVTITGVSIYGRDGRPMGPSPQILERCKTVFDDAEAILGGDGWLSDEQLGRVHGYRGTLLQLAAVETKTIQRLIKQYQRIMGALSIDCSRLF